MDFSSALNRNNVSGQHAGRDINNTSLRRTIDKNLVQLNGFLKQVRVYRTMNSFKYVDLRYNDLVIVKNNNLPVE